MLFYLHKKSHHGHNRYDPLISTMEFPIAIGHSVPEKLSGFIRHLSDGLYIFHSNLWNLSSDIWANRRKCPMCPMIFMDTEGSIFVYKYIILILNMRGVSFFRFNLVNIMVADALPLVSPGHQQTWYWLCRIGRYLSYLRKDFNFLSHVYVDEWHKM